MRSLLFAILTLSTLAATAAVRPIKLKMEVSVNGKVMSRPTLAMMEGVESSISQSSDDSYLGLEVTVVETGSKTAQVMVQIQRDANGETILDEGLSVITQFGTEGMIKSSTTKPNGETTSYQIKVLPTWM